jgi:hypothetical protein
VRGTGLVNLTGGSANEEREHVETHIRHIIAKLDLPPPPPTTVVSKQSWST